MITERLKASFDGPQHGWLALSLRAGDQKIEIAVEHVPFDLISELVDGLYNLMLGEPAAVARGHDGPILHQVHFEQDAGLTRLQVIVIYDVLKGKAQEELFTFADSTYNIVRSFWKALRDVETKQSLVEYQERWRESFPVREMELLTQSVKKAKNERS